MWVCSFDYVDTLLWEMVAISKVGKWRHQEVPILRVSVLVVCLRPAATHIWHQNSCHVGVDFQEKFISVLMETDTNGWMVIVSRCPMGLHFTKEIREPHCPTAANAIVGFQWLQRASVKSFLWHVLRYSNGCVVRSGCVLHNDDSSDEWARPNEHWSLQHARLSYWQLSDSASVLMQTWTRSKEIEAQQSDTRVNSSKVFDRMRKHFFKLIGPACCSTDWHPQRWCLSRMITGSVGLSTFELWLDWLISKCAIWRVFIKKVLLFRCSKMSDSMRRFVVLFSIRTFCRCCCCCYRFYLCTV